MDERTAEGSAPSQMKCSNTLQQTAAAHQLQGKKANGARRKAQVITTQHLRGSITAARG